MSQMHPSPVSDVLDEEDIDAPWWNGNHLPYLLRDLAGLATGAGQMVTTTGIRRTELLQPPVRESILTYLGGDLAWMPSADVIEPVNVIVVTSRADLSSRHEPDGSLALLIHESTGSSFATPVSAELQNSVMGNRPDWFYYTDKYIYAATGNGLFALELGADGLTATGPRPINNGNLRIPAGQSWGNYEAFVVVNSKDRPDLDDVIACTARGTVHRFAPSDLSGIDYGFPQSFMLGGAQGQNGALDLWLSETLRSIVTSMTLVGGQLWFLCQTTSTPTRTGFVLIYETDGTFVRGHLLPAASSTSFNEFWYNEWLQRIYWRVISGQNNRNNWNNPAWTASGGGGGTVFAAPHPRMQIGGYEMEYIHSTFTGRRWRGRRNQGQWGFYRQDGRWKMVQNDA